MAYQSHDGEAGDSQSAEKLGRIGLPENLNGKSVLDLGCNEGYFSLVAKRRGARAVLGIDHDARVIGAAQRRAEAAGLEIDFRVADMFDVPGDGFDYIIFLSALHYIAAPARLLQMLRNKLAPNGVLILEVGVAQGQGSRAVGRAIRSIDERFFPSQELLTHVWLRDYAVRLHGPSVAQAGDPIPRYTFHCTPAKTNVVFIVGNGGIGKSHLANHLGPSPVISTDALLWPACAPNAPLAPPQRLYIDSFRRTGSIWATWEEIKDKPDVRRYFAKAIATAIALAAGAGQIIVEGFVLADLSADIETMLGDEFRCWKMSREH